MRIVSKHEAFFSSIFVSFVLFVVNHPCVNAGMRALLSATIAAALEDSDPQAQFAG
jgi:hypothetical protein